MKPDLILQSDMLDILFEDRNKDYGAYALRKGYNTRMIKSVVAMLSAVSILVIVNFFLLPARIGKIDLGKFLPPDTEIRQVEIINQEKPIQPATRQVATIHNATPVISAKAETTVPDVDALSQDVQIGTETITGEPASTASEPVAPIAPEAPAAAPPVEEPSILHRAEIMPEFPGGEAALKRFMSKTLRVPEDELEAGAKITVRAKFIIDKDGKVIGIEILDSGGETFDNEVKRMLMKMPAWKPGSQNGRPVAVYFKLPVVFMGPEE